MCQIQVVRGKERERRSEECITITTPFNTKKENMGGAGGGGGGTSGPVLKPIIKASELCEPP